MNALHNYIAGINQQHREYLVQHQAASKLRTKSLLELIFFAGVFLVLATIGYNTFGYHFGFQTINSTSQYIPEFILHIITSFGDGAFVLTLVLLFANKHVRLHWVVFLTGVIGGIVSQTSKEFFDAARPPAVLALDSFNLYGPALKHLSFPSGHTLTAFLFATLGYYYADKSWQKMLFLFAGVLVGLSRIWLGVHWPADTLVGASLGILSASAALWLAHQWPKQIPLALQRFLLFLLCLAAIVLLADKNDYRLALPLLYASALAALWVSAKNYLWSKSMSEWIRSIDPGVWFWLVLGVLTLYRLLILLQPQFSLFYDEAYYYHWSLNPDFGYYSKPPMVAWCILLSTSLFGDGEIAVKLMANLLYGATATVIFYTVNRYASKVQAFQAGLIFLCIPMIGFNSAFITTDAPLIFFWSVSVFFALKALDENRLRDWLMLGASTGLGMLSKYTMGALPLAVFAFYLFSPGQRYRLAKPGPWVAAILAGLIFSSNILWNYFNDWIALKHTQEISETDGDLFNLGALFEFLITQFFIFGPISSVLLLRALFAYRNKESALFESKRLSAEHIRMLLWLMFLILGAIAIQAFLSRAFPNWAGPWLVAGTILLALLWPQAYKSETFNKWLSYSLAFNLILLSLFYHWPQFLRWIDVEPNRKNDPYHRLLGWPKLAVQLKPILQDYPNTILASDERDLLAYMGYYALPGRFNFARWNPQADNIRDYYDLKVNLRDWQGDKDQAFIFVSKEKLPDSMADRFEEYQPITELQYQVYADQTMRVSVSWVKGFKGYE